MKTRGGIRSQSGQTVLVVMIVGLALNTVLYLMFNYFPNLSRQAMRTGHILQYRLALNSMVDYTVHGVKNQWCFNDIWMQDGTCDLTHPRNSERLLLSSDAIDKIMARPSLPKGSPVRLNGFSRTVALADFTNLHPLYRMAQNLQAKFADDTGAVQNALEDEVTFTVTRIDNTAFPIRGRESFLRVRVSIGVRGGFGFLAASELYAETIVGVYPRELSLFGLIVPNDLRLDVRNGSSLNTGDVYIPLFNNKAAASAGTSPGLLFQSPVYINRHLHLPSKTTSPFGGSAADDYSAVTFADIVVLGDGLLFRDGSPAKPETAGGFGDQFNEQSGNMGGIKRGLRLDGFRDLGLDYLSGISSGTSPDRSLALACIERNNARSDLAATRESALIVRKHRATSYSASTRKRTFYYRIGLSEGNIFRPILNNTIRSDIPPAKREQPSNFTNSGTSTSWINGIVRIGNASSPFLVNARYGSESSMTMYPKIPPPSGAKCSGDDLGTVRSVGCGPGEVGVLLEVCATSTGPGPPVAYRELMNTCAVGTPPAPPLPTCGTGAGAVALGDVRNRACPVGEFGVIAELCSDSPTLGLQEVSRNCQPLPPQPEITFKTKPTMHVGASGAQPNQLDLEITVKDEVSIPDDIEIFLTAHELGTDTADGSNRRTGSTGHPGYSRSGRITLPYNATLSIVEQDPGIGTTYVVADPSKRSHPVHGTIANPIDESIDYAQLDTICNSLDGPNGASFGLADWDYDFAPASVSAWSFTVPEGNVLDLTIDSDNASSTGLNFRFHVGSIHDDCDIESSADFVAGFLVCRKLNIKNRTNPLRIVGTIIVTNELNIHRNAIRAGIVWSSIYHPQAVQDLRSVGLLAPVSGGTCPSDSPPFASPIWNPYPNIADLASIRKCSPISLRERADPFRWTTVDPDCGYIGANPHCKGRVRRYMVQEINREVTN